MSKLYIDFETYSAVDINTRGGYAYAIDPSTQLLCMGYAFDDQAAQVCTLDQELPDTIIQHVQAGGKIYAHNASFDYRIWNFVCSQNLGWPSLNIQQMIDSAALCLSYQIPAKLLTAGEALKITMPKDTEGTRLIRLLCMPNKHGKQPDPMAPYLIDEFKKLVAYCKRDVEAMRQVVESLPRNELIQKEQELWELTYEMNTTGLPVDFTAIGNIRKYTAQYVANASKNIPKLCGGAFQTVNQVAKIKEWANGCHDYELTTLDAAAVTKALDDPECPEPVKVILELRQELGRSSTAKFTKLENQAVPATYGYAVHDNLQYHGAGTGRWAGRGFQVHNLPRAKVKNPLEYIEKFNSNQEVENPVGVAKALIRSMILAPEGEELIVSDYSSIENRVLHWLANDQATLQDFRDGFDQYITMAAARYNKSYEYIRAGREAGDPECSAMRQLGKVIILGAGFGMGWETFVTTAKDQFGLTVTDEEAQLAITAYREKYFLVKKLWNELKLAAVKAVITGQRQAYHLITFGTSTIKGKRWLAMRLPSGKCIYYLNPTVDYMYIPKYENMGKVPTITHEGQNPYTKKWGRLKLIPGRITENAVQGTAREMMAQGLLNVKANLPRVKLVATVHDEAIGRTPIGKTSIEDFNKELCNIPWAEGCPITAEGWLGQRYKK